MPKGKDELGQAIKDWKKNALPIGKAIDDVKLFFRSPKEALKRKRSAKDAVGLFNILLVMLFISSVLYLPYYAYNQVVSHEKTVLSESAGYNITSPGFSQIDAQARQRANAFLSRFNALDWFLAVVILLLLSAFFSFLSLVMLGAKAAIRWLYLKLWKGKAGFYDQFVLDSYIAIMLFPFSAATGLIVVAGVLFQNSVLAITGLLLIIPLTIFNWIYYVNGNALIHDMSRGKAFIALFIPVLLVILLMIALFAVILLGAYLILHTGNYTAAPVTAAVIRNFA